MPKSEELDIQGVAALLGVSDRQVRTYMAAGLPSQLRGRKRMYDRAEVLTWHERYLVSQQLGERPLSRDDEDDDSDLDDSPPAAAPEKDDIRKVNLRRAKADADLKELALSEKRSEVVTIADARTRLDRLFGNLRTQLLGMAPKLATRLAGVQEPTEIESLIKDEMETLCRELATGSVIGAPRTIDGGIPAIVDEISAAAADGLSDRQLARAARKLERAYAAE